MDALRSHEHKMCVHGLEGLEICWSYLLKIGQDQSLVCAGRPCKNEYVPVNGPYRTPGPALGPEEWPS
jgi:hypothetical protein